MQPVPWSLSQWVEFENWISQICEWIIQTSYVNGISWFVKKKQINNQTFLLLSWRCQRELRQISKRFFFSELWHNLSLFLFYGFRRFWVQHTRANFMTVLWCTFVILEWLSLISSKSKNKHMIINCGRKKKSTTLFQLCTVYLSYCHCYKEIHFITVVQLDPYSYKLRKIITKPKKQKMPLLEISSNHSFILD